MTLGGLLFTELGPNQHRFMDALDIKVYAKGSDNVEVQGVIPLELPTTTRPSGCLPFRAHVYRAISSSFSPDTGLVS